MKAIVISVSGRECTVMKNNGEFSRIKNNNYSVGEEIALPSPFALKLSLCAAAAFSLLLASLTVINFLIGTASGYVYIDINPSFRLDVNRFGKVISILPLNDEADEISSGLDFSGTDVEECIERIVQICELRGYVGTGEGDVEISISSENSALEKRVLDASEHSESDSVQISVYTLSDTDNDYAIDNNISPKRLRAVREYTKYLGGDIEKNSEKLADVATDDIFELVREHRRSTKGADDKPVASNKEENRLSYISEKRLRALQRYIEEFGGTLEENLILLRGLSTKEINQEVSEHKKNAEE